MRVALVHDWLTGMRGGEKVLDALCEIFPRADLFTLFHAPGTVSGRIEARAIETSLLQKLPGSIRYYRHLLPLMPWAAGRFDLSGYDLVVSSSHCAAKGVRPPDGIPHFTYCHTPMRYIWDQYEEYFGPGRASLAARAAMSVLRRPLQRWDVRTAARVDAFIANSRNVADRIRRHYGRDSEVIPPPVDLDNFTLSHRDEGYYLLASALVPYKRVDVAVDAFNRSKRKLKIVGTGPLEEELKRRAGKSIEFLGWRTDKELAGYYAGCRALIFPGEEDFGIVPLEAMASGKPVIALGRGGALETVAGLDGAEPGEATGLFFDEPTAESLEAAVDRFERNRTAFVSDKIRDHVKKFSRPSFVDRLSRHIRSLYEKRGGRP